MNSRQRFLETMRNGAPDRVSLFEEGMRSGTLEYWHAQGFPKNKDLTSLFTFDRREEVALDLDLELSLSKLARSRNGLDRLRRTLNSNKRLPKGWRKQAQAWKEREHVLMLQVHEGFFLSLGIGEWRSFAEEIYLFADQPDFVRQAMNIYGEASARLTAEFLQRVQIDAAVFSEPIGGNHGSLVSPETYEEFVLNSYTPILETLQRFGVETIIFRTYANTRVLLPKVFEMDFNCLWAVERGTNAMDYVSIRKEFGEHLRLIGGIDLDVIRQDKQTISRELETVLPPLLAQGGYAPLADGRVRQDVPFENYTYYRRLLEGMVQRAGNS